MKRAMEVAIELKQWHDRGVYPFPLDRRQREMGRGSPLVIANDVAEFRCRQPLVWLVMIPGAMLSVTLFSLAAIAGGGPILGSLVFVGFVVGAVSFVVPLIFAPTLNVLLGTEPAGRIVEFYEAVIKAHDIVRLHLPPANQEFLNAPDSFAYFRWEDLERVANEALVALAYGVVVAQRRVAPDQLEIEAARAQFRESHATLLFLGLAAPTWDSYYRQAEERLGKEEKEMAVTVAASEAETPVATSSTVVAETAAATIDPAAAFAHGL